MTTAIEVRDLHYSPGKGFKLEGLALNVPSGSLYGFLGPNGAGKTTTIRLLLGLLRAEQGRISVLGHEVPKALPKTLARIGFVPERPHLHPYLTVRESIAFHSAFYPMWDPQWANDLVGHFRLDRNRRLSRLSKGEMGKLMMLQALCQTPDLLILDEPTDGLDPVIRRDVLSAILEYVSRRQATVFISSHLVHELERFCDWVGVLDQGRLVAEMGMEEFRSGMKRVRLTNAPRAVDGAPFRVLERAPGPGDSETWTVRGWLPTMAPWFVQVGAVVREVVDLDLEEGFVELLRSWRTTQA